MPEGFYNPAAVVTKTLDTSPRPWRVDNPGCEDWGVNIVDHDGARVAADLTEADAALIVAAVNLHKWIVAQNRLNAGKVVELMEERDRLRELVKRMIPAVEESFAIAKHEAESIKGICALKNVDFSEVDAVLSQWENLLREARTAIGEDEAEGERHA